MKVFHPTTILTIYCYHILVSFVLTNTISPSYLSKHVLVVLISPQKEQQFQLIQKTCRPISIWIREDSNWWYLDCFTFSRWLFFFLFLCFFYSPFIRRYLDSWSSGSSIGYSIDSKVLYKLLLEFLDIGFEILDCLLKRIILDYVISNHYEYFQQIFNEFTQFVIL